MLITKIVAYARQEQVLLFDIIWKLIACLFITQEATSLSDTDSTPEKKKRRIGDVKNQGDSCMVIPESCSHS